MTDIKKYVAVCTTCQRQKHSTLAPGGLLQSLPIPTNVWEDISMDFIEGLPKSEVYHPQSDGQTEVTNRGLKIYLRCYAGEQPRKWAKFLAWAEMSYNSSFHSAIKMTSFKALYGRYPQG